MRASSTSIPEGNPSIIPPLPSGHLLRQLTERSVVVLFVSDLATFGVLSNGNQYSLFINIS